MIVQTHLIGCRKEDLDTPALLVDLPTLERNTRKMADTIIRQAGVRWRPHTKGMKTPALAHRLLEAGAIGITCAKLGEAEVMAAGGVRDILIANQIVGPRKIARLVNLRRHADVMVCVDNENNVRQLNLAAVEKGVRVRVLIEVDVGMNRAGVAPGEPVLSLAQIVAACPGLQFSGLMTWEAHTLAIEDIHEKRRLIAESLSRITTSADLCRRNGLPVDIVSCGGTGTYWISAFQPGITEIEAGGGIFGDIRYRTVFGVKHEYALTVLSTVTSRPTPARIICDAGKKTMSSDAAVPEPIGIPNVTSVALSAEHGKIELSVPAQTPRVGETIEFVAGYSDTTVVLHDELYGIRDGAVEAVWPLPARGRLQ
ncbi:MAG: DSD1 family PLP-dependent enzyme [Candidatus Latescibacteria bacterium]|nr:DSD1 family PLP-dependent enzyme [Candidatus Latescibacterota bacterium]